MRGFQGKSLAATRDFRRARIVLGLSVAAAAGLLAFAAMAASVTQVSQRDRSFKPGKAELERGDTLRIVNDDGELIHHAYIKSDTYNFDSGEQAPGSHVDIVIPTSGTFTVLCAIHPKMHLTVTVK